MGIMYTATLSFESYKLNEKKQIGLLDKLKTNLNEFYQIGDEFRFSSENGLYLPFFERISKEYPNVLFHIKLARTDDFTFSIGDITFFWFYNGKYVKTFVNLVPIISIIEIDSFIKSNTLTHSHKFENLVENNGNQIIMSCDCGETKTFESLE